MRTRYCKERQYPLQFISLKSSMSKDFYIEICVESCFLERIEQFVQFSRQPLLNLGQTLPGGVGRFEFRICRLDKFL